MDNSDAGSNSDDGGDVTARDAYISYTSSG